MHFFNVRFGVALAREAGVGRAAGNGAGRLATRRLGWRQIFATIVLTGAPARSINRSQFLPPEREYSCAESQGPAAGGLYHKCCISRSIGRDEAGAEQGVLL